MDEKQKQIEEMAKIIDDRFIEARGYLGSMNRGEGYWIAQKLVEHYQPKLPEGSVVLTEEEFSEFRQTIINLSQEHTKKCDEMNDKIIKARKQAVKEVLERLKAETITIDPWSITGSAFECVYTDDIDEIAEEFGVEVE